jgi:hypothetical protein
MLETTQAQVVLYYDSCDSFGNDLGRQIEQLLSRSARVQSTRVLGGASPIIPVLEVIIVASSTVMLNSILSEAGKDIYNLFKDTITRKRKDEERPVMIIITTFSNDMATRGSIVAEDYKSAIDAIKTSQQMIIDASTRQKNKEELPDQKNITFIKHGKEFVSTVKSETLYQYEYDGKNDKWVLKDIRKIKEL